VLRAFPIQFVRNEQGSLSRSGLPWIILLVGVCGLMVSSTNDIRNRAVLESTAEAAALAAVIDLPDNGAAVAAAVAYSDRNAPVDRFGVVLRAEGVQVGSWDRVASIFRAGGTTSDAVSVQLAETEGSVTKALFKLLRLVGLNTGEANVAAVAQRFIPKCLQNGLVARGLVKISSNNDFTGRICIHGQGGVQIQRENYFEPGARLSMPDVDRQLMVPTIGSANNSGLPLALTAQSVDPRMVNHVTEFIADLLASKAYVTPDFIDVLRETIVKDETYDFSDLQPGRIYHIQCGGDKTVSIPNDTVLTKVAIISDCRVSVGENVSMTDVVLGSRAGGPPDGAINREGAPGANISFAPGVSLGAADRCQPGGGVQIFSDADVHFSPSTRLNGVQVVASGNVDLDVQRAGINGINVQAGGDITLLASNMFGLCSGGAPQFFPIFYYRLVA
jgi:hypothetical protein